MAQHVDRVLRAPERGLDLARTLVAGEAQADQHRDEQPDIDPAPRIAVKHLEQGAGTIILLVTFGLAHSAVVFWPAPNVDSILVRLDRRAEPGDERFGVELVARALEAPMYQIVANAALHPPIAIAEARKAGRGYGFDVRSKRIVQMIEEGIADSAYVVRSALERAASAAVMLLTTDAIVLHRKPKESTQP
mgnify:CR=1 FL=1